MSLAQRVNILLHSVGYHIKPAGEVFGCQRDVLIERSGVDLVIDVGANTGQYVDEIRRYGYSGRVWSFEPLQSAYDRLKERSHQDKSWNTFHSALGDSEGTLQINVSQNSQSSSFLPMLETHLHAAPQSKYIATEEVQIRRLDNVWCEQAMQSDKIFLKLDTQGYEAAVLRGASGIQSRVQFIECELSMVPLYGGQLLFAEMLDFISSLGFDAVNFAPAFIDPATRRCLQINGLFGRRLAA